MAERRPKGQGLERVLGTGALFSTAYGNVGSSIHYALGLVAALAARAVIEQARIQGGQRVSGHVERVRPGQTGRLIVQEAREMRARAIVMPLPPRTGTTIFGKTVETVLADRPCRVIIESDGANA
ncbi:MAG: hypothetical protein KY433_02280 [Actinobacteria bacterium]|nr:hypothetical protein [Actinomycetota bacterium]